MDRSGENPEFGLSELADRSGVPARTIRFYQSVDVLPRPDRRGRDAIYNEQHLERLRLIAELQDRGLTLGGIRHLLGKRASPGMSVGDWLGLDESLRGPWSEDRPRVVDDDELSDLLGTRPAGLRSRLERSGYLERRPDGWWFVRSPTLLDLALQLHDAGIDVEVTGRATDLLRRRLARAVDDLITLFVERTGTGFAGQASGTELATALATLRPVAREAAGIILAHEIERGLRELLEAGPTAIRKRPTASATRRRR
ncbi:MAG: MerR family transcriptional regulator [Ilumatobacteraceae bacterium]